ncbi:olfactory receptor 49-like [Solea senegalensis]|uniref:Olfactory receptor 49-like n=1 Tax=Solea senegalensis TaxID=28829 RepID=A0AAV6REV7_SOLSE|nr:olfactory receptor 11A1-like [Solea senegalensis]XP_043875285.1 olfactory receptor 11A1-like [Solea senegalensis]KAG7503931.1 olfactory receptor 49-like [Solea senegalensis]
MENNTVVTELTLSGLDFPMEHRIVLFLLTLLWYIIILFGNTTLIVAIIVDKKLHEPMYIFLCNLCINSLYGTVGFYPKFLLDLLTTHAISYAGCMLQGFVIHSSVCAEFCILALMAYDRYVAICKPLMYHVIMTKLKISAFLFLSWLIPLFCMFMNTATLLGSRLCGSHIQKVYCVNWMIVNIACSPPRGHTGVSYFNVLFFSALFVLIIWSYICLIRTCVTSTENQRKFMQTCLPHLIGLMNFTISILLDLFYMRFGSLYISQHLNNFMAMEFLLVPPAVNPFVYGFRLTAIRRKFVNLVFITRRNAKCEPVNMQT